jgi:hypothetical protein
MWLIAIWSVAALLIDAVIHVAAVVGLNPQDWVRPEWLLQTLFWVMFLATLGLAHVVENRRSRQAKKLGITLADRNPPWFATLRAIAIAYGLFCAFNFGVVDLRRAGGEPDRLADGSYIIDPGHGRAPRPISRDEYDRWRRRSALGGSGFFLMFYTQVAFDMVRYARKPIVEGHDVVTRRQPMRI